METLKKIFPLSFKYIKDNFVLTLVLHIVVALVIGIIPVIGWLASLYAWIGLILLVLNKLDVFKSEETKEEAPAEEKAEEKTEE